MGKDQWLLELGCGYLEIYYASLSILGTVQKSS